MSRCLRATDRSAGRASSCRTGTKFFRSSRRTSHDPATYCRDSLFANDVRLRLRRLPVPRDDEEQGCQGARAAPHGDQAEVRAARHHVRRPGRTAIQAERREFHRDRPGGRLVAANPDPGPYAADRRLALGSVERSLPAGSRRQHRETLDQGRFTDHRCQSLGVLPASVAGRHESLLRLRQPEARKSRARCGSHHLEHAAQWNATSGARPQRPLLVQRRRRKPDPAGGGGAHLRPAFDRSIDGRALADLVSEPPRRAGQADDQPGGQLQPAPALAGWHAAGPELHRRKADREGRGGAPPPQRGGPAARAGSPDGKALAYSAPVGAAGHFQLWWLALAGPPTPAATASASPSAGGVASSIAVPTPPPSPPLPVQVTQGVDLSATSAPAWY